VGQGCQAPFDIHREPRWQAIKWILLGLHNVLKILSLHFKIMQLHTHKQTRLLASLEVTGPTVIQSFGGLSGPWDLQVSSSLEPFQSLP
jgi:hypothetical protein